MPYSATKALAATSSSAERPAARAAAIDRLCGALEAFEIQGLKNNIPAVLAVLRSDAFRAGDLHTGLIPEVLKKK